MAVQGLTPVRMSKHGYCTLTHLGLTGSHGISVEVSAIARAVLIVPSPAFYHTQFTSYSTSGIFRIARLHVLIEIHHTLP